METVTSDPTGSYGLVFEFLDRINFEDANVSTVALICFTVCFIAFLVYRAFMQARSTPSANVQPTTQMEGMSTSEVIKFIGGMIEETTQSVHSMNASTEKFCNKLAAMEQSFTNLATRIDKLFEADAFNRRQSDKPPVVSEFDDPET